MAQLTIPQALERYSRICGTANKKKTLDAVEKYLRWGGQPTDENLAAYLAALDRQGLKPATIDLRRRQIRAFWRAIGAPVPRTAMEFHPEHDSDRVTLAAAAIHQMISHADRLSPYQRALLVTSTVYGPRALELSRIQSADVDLDHGRWYIRSAKGSRARWLWIPESLRPLLDIRWPSVTVEHVERQFGRIWILSELENRPPHVGWHAIRRALTIGLAQNGVPDGDIARFMRWSSGGEAGHKMVALYKGANQEVGVEGLQKIPRSLEGSMEDDESVWRNHPSERQWNMT